MRRSLLVLLWLALACAPLAAAPEAKWSVDNPPGPSHAVPIDTDEGTWMDVDLSPDGREIAFDLLGQIYVIPADGGAARALTHGMAWSMQPRYSPDGRWIAFTSDRGGGDNIWIMARDGSHAHAVTHEKFRLLNSPAWTPDSQFVAARKHFTSHRSLGAGEVWLYHRAGGDGAQMTKRPTDQKDLGEPAFSPDGKYLYYSQDVTPGASFEYNKDSNGEIYAIQRLDRDTGEVERFVGGAGGAVRPTPSPDGKTLAFVRRVRGKSVLFVRDVASGEERPLYDALDRDMQETWAIHGVYPTMAWTPDNRRIVLWAGGRIRRVDVASGQSAVIPFHVKDARRVTEAVRFPVAVAPPRFEAKMLRWVSVSPRGDRLAFQALGHVWIQDLPQGSPRRLTSDNDVFEMHPAFSRDGRFIVYTTWNDDALGTVRVCPAAGGPSQILTKEPGHYADPSISPDGSWVVFRKLTGGYLTSPHWGSAGIFGVPITGGTPQRICRDGEAPHFGAASDRVFLTRDGEDDMRNLVSVDRTGAHERTHVTCKNVTEIRVSPDERWVAFVTGFNAYVAPLARTGKAIELTPEGGTVPVARVSRDAGAYVHFSGNARSLQWTHGNQLFTRDLRDAFAFLEGSPAKLPEPPAQGRAIHLEAAADVPSGTVALVGGRAITMHGNEVIENATLVVEGNRIAALGPADRVEIPPGACVVDVHGQTLMPGIVDVHWHGSQAEEGVVPQRNWVNYASLAFGVTTIHDPSNDTEDVFAASEMAKAGLITAPHVFSTGTILYGAAGSYHVEINSLEDARHHLRRMQAAGAFSVKSYNQPRREQRQQIVAAARELGMMVVPEGGSLFHHNMTMVVDGHTGVEHSLPVARIYDDVVQLWSHTAVGHTPTLIVAYGGLAGETYWYSHTNVWENQRLATFVPRDRVDPRSRRRPIAPEEEYNHCNAARVDKRLNDAGVSVQLGAHGQREGLGAHWEMWMMVQGGMSPLQALRCATLNGARYLGLDHDVGSLEVGKIADVVVMRRNPLDDIRNTESVRYVMANGRLFDADTLDEAGNHPRKRGRLYWESQPAERGHGTE